MERIFSPIIKIQSVVSADPEPACPILKNRADKIVTQTSAVAGSMPESFELLRGAIESIEAAAERSDPENACVVFIYFEDRIVADGFWVAGIGAKNVDGVSVVLVEPVQSAEPEKSLAVLKDGKHRRLRQPLFEGDMLKARFIDLAVTDPR